MSLKGDLALRLPAAATPGGQVGDRQPDPDGPHALRDVRGVTRGQPRASYQAEIDGAATLLAAAGIDARIDADLAGAVAGGRRRARLGGPRRGDQHPAPQRGRHLLDHRPAGGGGGSGWRSSTTAAAVGQGTGLAGLAGGRALSGSVSASAPLAGRFQLQVEVPEEAPA